MRWLGSGRMLDSNALRYAQIGVEVSENITTSIQPPSVEQTLLRQFAEVRMLGIEPAHCYLSHDRFEGLRLELGARCEGVYDPDDEDALPGMLLLAGVTVCDESLHRFARRSGG